MSTITDAFDASAREFLKETWVKRARSTGWHHPLTGEVLPPDSSYPAEVLRHVEVEIDGALTTFAVRIRPVEVTRGTRQVK